MTTNLWLITAYAHSWLDNLLYVAAVTDVPCHLWLRWTDNEERMHLRQKDRRGVLFLAVPDYCFVEWSEVEQNEAGDTTHHTFNFNTWGHCQRRWWHLRGQIGGADSPSSTPIFTAHYEDQEEAVSLKHTDLIDKNPGGVLDHADKSVTAAKLEDDLDGVPRGLNADKVDGYHAAQLGAGTWIKIAEAHLEADADIVVFDDIPAAYRMLRLTGYTKRAPAADTIIDQSGVGATPTTAHITDDFPPNGTRRFQGFTASQDYNITRVRFQCYRPGGTTPGDIYVRIKAGDASGYPTGPILASGHIPEAEIPVDVPDWVEKIFATPAALTSGEKYCIVLSCPHDTVWLRVFTDDPYPGGDIAYSDISEWPWTYNAAVDLYFECYGAATGPTDLRLVLNATLTMSYAHGHHDRIGAAVEVGLDPGQDGFYLGGLDNAYLSPLEVLIQTNHEDDKVTLSSRMSAGFDNDFRRAGIFSPTGAPLTRIDLFAQGPEVFAAGSLFFLEGLP